MHAERAVFRPPWRSDDETLDWCGRDRSQCPGVWPARTGAGARGASFPPRHAGHAAVLPRAVAAVGPHGCQHRFQARRWCDDGGGDEPAARAQDLRSLRRQRARLSQEPAAGLDPGGLARAVLRPARRLQPEPAAGEGRGGRTDRSAQPLDRRLPDGRGRDLAAQGELRQPDCAGLAPQMGDPHLGVPRRPARGEACRRQLLRRRLRRRRAVGELPAVRRVGSRHRQRPLAAARDFPDRDPG